MIIRSTDVVLAYNGYGLPKAGIRSTKAEPLHKSQIVVKMFNLPRLPSFWQTDVTGRCGLILKQKSKWN